MATGRQPAVILCADDFAMTEGVSLGIEELALAGRLSAVSALVTTRQWTAHGTRLAALRGHVAVGLHFNLTLGAPLGPMPRLAPGRRLPAIAVLTRMALGRRVEAHEVAMEAGRQLAAFEAATGFSPDFVDGHQHVHALPGVRDGVIAALRQHFPHGGPLVRTPADQVAAILSRGLAVPKSIALSGLAFGFASLVRRAGLPTNDTFSGVTDFRPEDAAEELHHAMRRPGRLHLVMCHPGFPDSELAAIDPITVRRRAEYDALMEDGGLTAAIWRPQRAAGGPAIDWSRI